MMFSPPFKRAPTTFATASTADACCITEAQGATPPRRLRLSELDPHVHCSIIGTCLSTAELRKLIPRFCDLHREQATDLEIHHTAVQLAHEGGPAAKAIHKALDDRYEATVKRLRALKSDEDLREGWKDALRSGEVPGTYWALMTHPHATPDIRQLAFGDVHMLSHLVGSANRADVRRLVALQRENDELAQRLENQQLRFHEVVAEREALSASLAGREIRLQMDASIDPAGSLRARIETLEADLMARDQLLAHQTHRREVAETQTQAGQALLTQLQEQLANATALIHSLDTELSAVEAALSDRLQPPSTQPGERGALHHKRIVYVGGRPASTRVIKAIVESAGGEFFVHDGGIEDRKGLLATALPKADMVVFPVDCIDHDSMFSLKRTCEKHRVPYHPLRTASAASFSALLERLDAEMMNPSPTLQPEPES